jgi:acyl-CoA oxidase
MIIDGTFKGIHPFIVQIRSLDDHQPLPGIKVGDLGTKMGYNFVDNGWLSFD